MPIYEYECTHCSARFEMRRGFNSDTPVFCPQCGDIARRVFFPVPVIFKGSGFYATDSRGNNSASETGDTDKTKAGSTKDEKESPRGKLA